MAVLPWHLSTFLALLTATKLYVNKNKGISFLRVYGNNCVTSHVHGSSCSLMTMWLGLPLVHLSSGPNSPNNLDYLAPKSKEASFSETPVIVYQSTRGLIPERLYLQDVRSVAISLRANGRTVISST
jgi:hypothetical protein